MEDDASSIVELTDAPYLAHMFATYPLLQMFLQIYLPQMQLLSCVI